MCEQNVYTWKMLQAATFSAAPDQVKALPCHDSLPRRSFYFAGLQVYLEQSIGESIPLFWRASKQQYSLALPRDTEFVAVRVDAEDVCDVHF
eukprot:Skav200580  [mRNA]  locus=scaffold303:1801:6547:+ [translate_table: standard]